jgi:hypothetical protein
MARERCFSITSSYDYQEDISVVGNYIWNTSTLAWEKQTASAGGGGGGGGPVSVADGADVTSGSVGDVAVTTDSAGTLSGKLRGLVKILASVWDSLNGRLKVDGSGVTQPVSGTFWQATQPVSVSGAVSVTGPLTDTQLRATAVPVSGPLTDTQLRALAVPVSGTFWQATQPVSGPLTDTQLRAAAVPVSGTISAGLNAGTNRVGSVRVVDSADGDLTSAKSIQTTRFIGVQQAHHAGRTHINLYAVGAAAGATGVETAISLTKSSGTDAVSTAVSHAITSGKTFRITSITFATRGHATATAQVTTFRLRINTAGAVITTSTPIPISARCATPATANAWDRFVVPIGDGFEITGTGTLQIGVTANAVFTTNAPTWDVLITGYEY